MAGCNNSHYTTMKAEFERIVSQDLSDEGYQTIADHFNSLSVSCSETELPVTNSGSHTRNVAGMLQEMEASNILSPDNVVHLETIADLAESPLAERIVKEYKTLRKLKDSTENQPSMTQQQCHGHYCRHVSDSCLEMHQSKPSDLLRQTSMSHIEGGLCISPVEMLDLAICYLLDNPIAKWKPLASKLGLTFDDIEVIEEDCRFVLDKNMTMYTTWRRLKGNCATLDSLLKALEEAKQVDLKERLEAGKHLHGKRLNNVYFDDNK